MPRGCACLLGVLLLASQAIGENPPGYLTSFGEVGGSGGGSAGRFRDPGGIAMDSNGDVYVIDEDNDRVQVFDPGGTYLRKWSVMPYAADVAVDSLGFVYVTVQTLFAGNRVYKYNSNGVEQFYWGSGGSGNGQFQGPTGIDVDASDVIWVADSGNGRVQWFDTSGNYLGQFGSPGTGDGQFQNPVDVCADDTGDIFVLDQGNRRVQKFTSTGTFLLKWGSPGSGDGQFDVPSGMGVGASGNVFVVDKDNHRVQKFDNNGTFLTKWSVGSGNWDVAVDDGDVAYVTNKISDNVRLYGSVPISLATNWSHQNLGDLAVLRTYGGRPITLALMYVVAVDDIPFVQRVLNGFLDSDGHWKLATNIPNNPVLRGHKVTLLVFSIASKGNVVVTNTEDLTIL